MGRWQTYHQTVGDNPNKLVVQALTHFVRRRSAALDLGAGNFRDSKYLLSQGFGRVVAVDSSEESLLFWEPGIEFHQESLETFEPEKEAFDFACACNTLFFLFESKAVQVVDRVREALRPGGIFVCNVLGPQDDWVTQGNANSWFTQGSLHRVCTGFEILLNEEVYDPNGAVVRLDSRVPKCWHTFRLIFRKP